MDANTIMEFKLKLLALFKVPPAIYAPYFPAPVTLGKHEINVCSEAIWALEEVIKELFANNNMELGEVCESLIGNTGTCPFCWANRDTFGGIRCRNCGYQKAYGDCVQITDYEEENGIKSAWGETQKLVDDSRLLTLKPAPFSEFQKLFNSVRRQIHGESS